MHNLSCAFFDPTALEVWSCPIGNLVGSCMLYLNKDASLLTVPRILSDFCVGALLTLYVMPFHYLRLYVPLFVSFELDCVLWYSSDLYLLLRNLCRFIFRFAIFLWLFSFLPQKAICHIIFSMMKYWREDEVATIIAQWTISCGTWFVHNSHKFSYQNSTYFLSIASGKTIFRHKRIFWL